LKGRYFANVFLHFEPHGHTERYNEKEAASKNKPSAKERYEKAFKNSAPPPPKYDLPEYIQAGSEEETKWRQQYIFQAVEPVRVIVVGIDILVRLSKSTVLSPHLPF
jgi:cell division protein FtsN